MFKIDRPAAALTDWRELEIGKTYWYVDGFPETEPMPYVITRLPVLFKDHPKYSEVHKTLGDYVVFDRQVTWDATKSVMGFASDHNLMPGYSYNDNYMFRTEADALAYVEAVGAAWATPEGIVENARREEESRRWDYGE